MLQKADTPQKKIEEYLATKDILLAPGQTPLQAIQHERQYAYLGTQVFNMETGALKIESIVHMLTRLTVTTSLYEHESDTSGNIISIVGGWATRLVLQIKSYCSYF